MGSFWLESLAFPWFKLLILMLPEPTKPCLPRVQSKLAWHKTRYPGVSCHYKNSYSLFHIHYNNAYSYWLYHSYTRAFSYTYTHAQSWLFIHKKIIKLGSILFEQLIFGELQDWASTQYFIIIRFSAVWLFFLLPKLKILLGSKFLGIGFFVEWYINFCGLFNSKVILGVERQWYYIIHIWEDKVVHNFLKCICQKVKLIMW